MDVCPSRELIPPSRLYLTREEKVFDRGTELRLEEKEDGEKESMNGRGKAIEAKQRSERAWIEAKHVHLHRWGHNAP